MSVARPFPGGTLTGLSDFHTVKNPYEGFKFKPYVISEAFPLVITKRTVCNSVRKLEILLFINVGS